MISLLEAAAANAAAAEVDAKRATAEAAARTAQAISFSFFGAKKKSC